MVAALGFAACAGGATIEAHGVEYPVSDREAALAANDLVNEPPATADAPNARCDYWQGRAMEAISGTHDVTAAVLVWHDIHNSEEFVKWAVARRDEACADAKQIIAKKKARDDQAAAEQAEEQSRLSAVREAESRRRAADAVEEEARTGRCTDKHADEMQRNMAGIDDLFGRILTQQSSTDVYSVVAHRLVVATPHGTSLSFDVGIGGQHQIYALSYDPSMKLKVTDEQGYEVKAESPYDGLVAQQSELPTKARVVHANPGGSIPITVAGRGCTLVVAIRKD